MVDSSKEFLLRRIATLEAEKIALISESSKLTKLVSFQRDTIVNLRQVGIGMRNRIKILVAGI